MDFGVFSSQATSCWQHRVSSGLLASLAALQILAALPAPAEAKEPFLQSTGRVQDFIAALGASQCDRVKDWYMYDEAGTAFQDLQAMRRLPECRFCTPPSSHSYNAGARGLLAEEEGRLFELRQELEGEARQELNRARMELEEKGRTTQAGKLCATPFGVDVVGITEFIALTGALVGGTLLAASQTM